MTTVTQIADRLEAINATIGGVRARRTFPPRLDSAMLPVLVALPGHSERDEARLGAGYDRQTRAFRLVLIAGAWMSGLPTESAQRKAETLIDAVQAAYLARPRLELDGVPLDGVLRVTFDSDSGIVPLGEYAAVEFHLTVTYLKAI
jgi:hypothetical protein